MNENNSNLISLVISCVDTANRNERAEKIIFLLSCGFLFQHYKNKKTQKRVLSESDKIEHDHELKTAIALTDYNYHVLFAPKGLFYRNQKKFDIFLITEFLLLKADLKSISSKNPDTIAKRINEGSEQASIVIIDIRSDILPKDLISGLKSGCFKNQLIREIILFYKRKYYRLAKSLIISKNIYKVIQ